MTEQLKVKEQMIKEIKKNYKTYLNLIILETKISKIVMKMLLENHSKKSEMAMKRSWMKRMKRSPSYKDKRISKSMK